MSWAAPSREWTQGPAATLLPLQAALQSASGLDFDPRERRTGAQTAQDPSVGRTGPGLLVAGPTKPSLTEIALSWVPCQAFICPTWPDPVDPWGWQTLECKGHSLPSSPSMSRQGNRGPGWPGLAQASRGVGKASARESGPPLPVRPSLSPPPPPSVH